MFISGFTFLRNAVRLDYPFVESIRSILPVCDEFVVALGPCDDDTEAVLRSLHPGKMRIVPCAWNENVARGGYLFAQQANIGLFNCRGTWAFHLQADEVVHEDGLPELLETAHRHANNPRVDALALRQICFVGDYATSVTQPEHAAGNVVRIVKPHHFVLSRADSAGFTVHPKYKERGRKPRAVECDATLFHYVAVRSPEAMRNKRRAEAGLRGHGLFEIDAYEQETCYAETPRSFVGPFEGTHPAVMAERIERFPFSVDLDSPKWRTELNDRERRTLRRARLAKWLPFLTPRSYRRVA